MITFYLMSDNISYDDFSLRIKYDIDPVCLYYKMNEKVLTSMHTLKNKIITNLQLIAKIFCVKVFFCLFY